MDTERQQWLQHTNTKSWTLLGVIITEIQLDVKAVAGHISGAFGAVGHGQVNFNLAWILQA